MPRDPQGTSIFEMFYNMWMCDRTEIEMFSDAVSARMSVDNIDDNFHIHTVQSDTINFFFIYQMLHN